jgi:hypothetical protein
MKRGTYEFERIAELNLRLAKLRKHRARLLAALGREGEGPNVTRLLAHANIVFGGSSSCFVPAAPPIRSVRRVLLTWPVRQSQQLVVGPVRKVSDFLYTLGATSVEAVRERLID